MAVNGSKINVKVYVKYTSKSDILNLVIFEPNEVFRCQNEPELFSTFEQSNIVNFQPAFTNYLQ